MCYYVVVTLLVLCRCGWCSSCGDPAAFCSLHFDSQFSIDSPHKTNLAHLDACILVVFVYIIHIQLMQHRWLRWCLLFVHVVFHCFYMLLGLTTVR